MKFSCERCLYSTDIKKCFERHKLSKTHIKKENNEFEGKYQCKICNKGYRSNCGYYAHTKTNACQKSKKIKDEEEIEKKLKEYEEIKKIIIDLYKQNTEILKENKEIIKENSEMKNMLVEISKKDFVTNNIENIENNTNSHNKFDINIFLNDKCKNAINFSSLIESIVIGIKDIKSIEENGYVKTITDIITEKIGDYSIYERPLHYIENKKDEEPPNDTIHIKDNDIWNEEDLSEHDVLLTNINKLNTMVLEKTKDNEQMNQVVKIGRRYNKTGKIITNILDKVKINEEELSVEQ